MVTLVSRLSQLVLESVSPHWCSVTLRHGGMAVVLGADTGPMVLERLRVGLSDVLTGPVAGKIDDASVVWVLTLAERHTSIYAADQGPHRVLFVQDADGMLIGRFDLRTAERRQWAREIERAIQVA